MDAGERQISGIACVDLERRQILRLPLALRLPCPRPGLPFPLENDTKMEPVATSGPTMRGSGEEKIRGAEEGGTGNGEGVPRSRSNGKWPKVIF